MKHIRRCHSKYVATLNCIRPLIFLAGVSLLAFSYFPNASGDITPSAQNEVVIKEFFVDPKNHDITFSFPAKVGTNYAVDRSTTLRPASLSSAGWLEIKDSLVAQSEIQSFTDPGAAADHSKFFYRVRVQENSSSRTALMYARECEKHLGPFPKFRYEDAIEIPITQNGKRVIVTAENIGKNLRSGDKPAAFGAPYQLGNRVGRYQGIKSDGSSNPDVAFVTFFRDGGLGVIGHNMKTGATCFLSIKDEISGKQNLPTPDEPEYDKSWQPPAVVAADGCVKCHMADPFLHSPWIDQVRDPKNPELTLVPLIADFDSPYFVIGKEFPTPPGRNPGAILATIPKHLEGNKCIECHAPQCVPDFFNVKLDELKMSAPFHTMDKETRERWIKDRDAIREYCRSLDIEYSGGEGGEE